MRKFLLALSMFAFASCDSHQWEDTTDLDGNTEKGTKRLFKGHGSHDNHSDIYEDSSAHKDKEH